MAKRERCFGCIRPICQRQLNLKGCKQRNDQDISKETIDNLSLNPYEIHNLFSG